MDKNFTYIMYKIYFDSRFKVNIFWNCIAFRNAIILIVVERIWTYYAAMLFSFPYKYVLVGKTYWKGKAGEKPSQIDNESLFPTFVVTRFKNFIKLFLELSINCFTYAASRLITNQIALKFSSFISNNVAIIFFRLLNQKASKATIKSFVSFPDQFSVNNCYLLRHLVYDKG